MFELEIEFIWKVVTLILALFGTLALLVNSFFIYKNSSS